MVEQSVGKVFSPIQAAAAKWVAYFMVFHVDLTKK
jgi:hypothetical protein